ncbi:hypothetical protein ACOMHN_060182 [Nucella lapillus]
MAAASERGGGVSGSVQQHTEPAPSADKERKENKDQREDQDAQDLSEALVEYHYRLFRKKLARLSSEFQSDISSHLRHVRTVQRHACCGTAQDRADYSRYKERFVKSREDDATRTYSLIQVYAQCLKESIKYAARCKGYDEQDIRHELGCDMAETWEGFEECKRFYFDDQDRTGIRISADPDHWRGLGIMQAELYRYYKDRQGNHAAIVEAMSPHSHQEADHRPDREAKPGPSADVCYVETRSSTQSLTPPPHPPSPQCDAGHTSRCPTEGADHRQDPGSPGQRSAPAVDTGPDGTARTDRSSVRASVIAPRTHPDSALTSQQSDFTRKVLKTPPGRRKGPSRWEPADDPRTSPPGTPTPVPDPDPSPVGSTGDCSSADRDPQTAHQSRVTPLDSRRVPPRNSASDTAHTSLTQTPPQLREQSVTSPGKATSPKREPQSSRMDTEESGITAEPVDSNPAPRTATSTSTQADSFKFQKYARIPSPKRRQILDMFPPYVHVRSCKGKQGREQVKDTKAESNTRQKAEGGLDRRQADPESDRKEENGAHPKGDDCEAWTKVITDLAANKRERGKRAEQSEHSDLSPRKKLKTM